MLVTGLPPNVDGTVIAPDVDELMANDDDEPPPTEALPLLTVYVHFMPLTVSVAANAVSAAIIVDKQNIDLNTIMTTSFDSRFVAD